MEPSLTADQLRELRDMDRDLLGTFARLTEAAADLKDARADYDAARKAILDYLHDVLTITPPPLPLFDIDQAEADLRAMADPQPTDPT